MNSVFEIFKIGIGPSSSHTVGPMKAARRFRKFIKEQILESDTIQTNLLSVKVELYGSLASTGIGHGTDKAIILGLLGHKASKVEIDVIESELERTRSDKIIPLSPELFVSFPLPQAIRFRKGKLLPKHSNGMRFLLINETDQTELFEKIYYSVGGGFIVEDSPELHPCPADTEEEEDHEDCEFDDCPYPFSSAQQLLETCSKLNLTIARLMLENERSKYTDAMIDTHIQTIWNVMGSTIDRGCKTIGLLPGRLEVARRAPMLFEQLNRRKLGDELTALDWVNLWAIATNEENAAGGRIVTAPTNGAAGVIPSVLSYYNKFHHTLNIELLRDFFLTAAAIGSLYKRNASISGAEVGCQGEVGVACSMAAAGLAALMGGNIHQIENAAEIGMEHNLGLTCDPIAGLVQIPCIERNAMGATKAISAARLALQGSGSHKVSLDKVIGTMRRTGKDMKTKYKETSKGGLAVNAVDC